MARAASNASRLPLSALGSDDDAHVIARDLSLPVSDAKALRFFFSVPLSRTLTRAVRETSAEFTEPPRFVD